MTGNNVRERTVRNAADYHYRSADPLPPPGDKDTQHRRDH